METEGKIGLNGHYFTAESLMLKYNGELPGMEEPAPAAPYPKEEGINTLISPPTPIKGTAFCQPKIRLLNG